MIIRKISSVTLALGLVMCCSAAAPAAGSGLAEALDQAAAKRIADAGVKKLVDAWVAFWNSYDLNQVDKLFLTDDRVTYFSSEKEGLIRGIENVRKHHEGFGFVKGGKVQQNKLWVEGAQADVFGSTAVVAGIWFFERAEPAPGKDKIQRGPFTAVLVKQDGECRIAHMNFGNYIKN